MLPSRVHLLSISSISLRLIWTRTSITSRGCLPSRTATDQDIATMHHRRIQLALLTLVILESDTASSPSAGLLWMRTLQYRPLTN